jgi:hypothetical protein
MAPQDHLRGKLMKNLIKYAVAAAAMTAALPATEANAATLVVSLTGVQTIDARLDPSNIVQFFNIGAGARVTGLTYNITIATIGGSYRSEAGIAYTDSPITDGVLFRPGIADTSSGTSTYTGTSNLVDLGLDFFVGANGLLRVEYYEAFDDIADAADANLSGTLTFTYEPAASAVPEPATWGMMILGFGMIGASVRRRSAVKTAVTFA